MSFSAVIFDLDGTLVDSRRDIAVSVNHMLARYGLETLPLETIESYVGSGAEALVRRSMGAESGRFDIPAAVTLFRAHYLDHCLDTTRPFPRITEILERLKGRGVALAVVTNKPSAMARRMLGRLALDRWFDLMVGGDDVARMKPDTEAARIVFDRLGCTAALTLMVGDSAIDAAFARAAGMRCVLVGFGGIATTAEFAGTDADWRCETPDQLHDLLIGTLFA